MNCCLRRIVSALYPSNNPFMPSAERIPAVSESDIGPEDGGTVSLPAKSNRNPGRLFIVISPDCELTVDAIPGIDDKKLLISNKLCVLGSMLIV